MSKRSSFKPLPRDLYETPIEAVRPLMLHLKRAGRTRFIEPCAGSGKLVRHIETLAAAQDVDVALTAAYDIHPLAPNILKLDAHELKPYHLDGADTIITNPPFTWHVLKHLIPVFTHLAPTWLLLPHDFSANLRCGPFMEFCHIIRPIGRVKWFEDSPHMSTDNFCWYQFRDEKVHRGPITYPRRRLKGL